MLSGGAQRGFHLGCLVSRWCIEADGTNRTYKLFNIYVGPQQSRALLFCVTAKSSGQHFVFVPPLASRVPWCCPQESSALTQHLYWCQPWPLVCPGSVLREQCAHAAPVLVPPPGVTRPLVCPGAVWRRAARSPSTCIGATPGLSCALVLSSGEQRAHPAPVLVPPPGLTRPLVCPGAVLRRAARSPSTCIGATPGLSCALVLSAGEQRAHTAPGLMPRLPSRVPWCLVLSCGEQRAHPALVLVPTLATSVPWFCLEESSALTQHLCWCHPLASPGHLCALVLSCGQQRAHTPPVLMPPPGISCARASFFRRRAARSRTTCADASPCCRLR